MNALRLRNARWQRICDWYKIRDGYWFAPKLYGFGATPVRWQGWALLAIFVAAAAGVAWLGKVYSPVLLALLVPLVAGLVYLCWIKTDGDWKWRWGADQ